jgi:tRNA wybutosine-synthesizing protein 1
MGEPTLYPMIGELVEEVKRRGMTAFLVTNGTSPEAVGEVRPTQLYISLNAPDEETYRQVSNPRDDTWGRFLESLDMMRDSPSRRVVRLTLARNLNLKDPRGYARLIEVAEPDFVEVKAYMHLGLSRKRLGRDAMPTHDEVMGFARELSDILGYPLKNHVPLSRVALLSRGSAGEKIELGAGR